MLAPVHTPTCILDLQDGVAAGCYVGDDTQKECGVLLYTLVEGKLKHTCVEPGQEPQWWGRVSVSMYTRASSCLYIYVNCTLMCTESCNCMYK